MLLRHLLNDWPNKLCNYYLIMQKIYLDISHFRSIIQLTGVEVTEETVLVLESLGYFGRIGALLDQIPKRVLANYLVLRHVLDLAGATTDKMRQLQGETDLQNSLLYRLTVLPNYQNIISACKLHRG